MFFSAFSSSLLPAMGTHIFLSNGFLGGSSGNSSSVDMVACLCLPSRLIYAVEVKISE